MVEGVIENFNAAFRNTSLLLSGNVSDERAYFEAVFDHLLGLYIGLNRPVMENYFRDLESPGTFSKDIHDHMQPGHENSRLFSTLLIYLPDLQDPGLRHHRLDRKPELQSIEHADIRKRIEELTDISHDGAILWDPHSFNSDYVILGGFWPDACDWANLLSGRNAEYVQDACRPFLPSDYVLATKNDGHKQGSKTLTAITTALAVEGAVAFALKATSFRFGLGRVAMFTQRGLTLEGFVDAVPGLSEDKYVDIAHQIAIVKQRYRFHFHSAELVAGSTVYLRPGDIGLTHT